MKKKILAALLPLVFFAGWICFEKPKGGVIWIVFFICFIWMAGLIEMLGLDKKMKVE